MVTIGTMIRPVIPATGFDYLTMGLRTPSTVQPQTQTQSCKSRTIPSDQRPARKRGGLDVNKPLLLVNHTGPVKKKQCQTRFKSYLPHVFQRPVEELHPNIQKKLRAMSKESFKTGFEFEFFAIEFDDGTVIISDRHTSRSPFRIINNQDRKDCITNLLHRRTVCKIARGKWPVKIYTYHTHPLRVGVAENGYAFTQTNTTDCDGWETNHKSFIKLLNIWFGVNDLDFEDGAVPALSDPERPFYIATYRPSHKKETSMTF